MITIFFIGVGIGLVFEILKLLEDIGVALFLFIMMMIPIIFFLRYVLHFLVGHVH